MVWRFSLDVVLFFNALSLDVVQIFAIGLF